MKRTGRPYKIASEAEKAAIKEYLSSEKSYREVAQKYGVNPNSLRYLVNRGNAKTIEKNAFSKEGTSLALAILGLEEISADLEKAKARIDAILASVRKIDKDSKVLKNENILEKENFNE